MGRIRLQVGMALACVAAAALTVIGGASALAPNGPSPSIVISQVYGAGGNNGALLNSDYVELFNRGATAQSVAGWSIQYGSATGTGAIGASGGLTALPSVSIPAGGYLLVAESGGANGAALPTPDVSGGISMAASAGKVALVSSTTPLGCNGGSSPCSDAQKANVVDLVGYGSANFFEGTGAAGAPTISTTLADFRAGGGCVDTDSNSSDFAAAAPAPRNSASPAAPCGGVVPSPTNPSGTGTATPGSVDAGSSTLLTVAVRPGANPASTGIAVTANLTSIGGSAAQQLFDDGTNGDVAANDGTFSYAATVALSSTPGGKSLPVSITDAQSRSGSTTIALTVAAACGSPYTPIPAIQGSGNTAAVTGSVSTEGVVVGDYEGPQPALRGFYLEDPTGDGDPATSDGIFVFDNGANLVSLGDRVRVTGTAGESQGQTELSFPTVKACGSGTVAPVDVSLPVPAATGGVDYMERFEGMLVRFPQTLSVTEHFQLGRFGQVVMSSGGRLYVPTALVDPGAPAVTLEAQNRLRQIIVDDAFQTQNPDPIVFGRGGDPLSAVNTLRGGDTATGMVGVLTYTWAGNSASGNAYRLRPIGALGGGVPAFQPTNPRPTAPPVVHGNVKVAAMNLLNFFNTFDGFGSNPPWACNGGVGGTLMDCRGADDQDEFDRQWPKTVAAIVKLNPDVLGIMEIENDGYGPNSAIQFLVDRLNDATSPGKYAFIDADAATGEVNALGDDAIKVGILYQPARVTPVGQTAVLNTVDFVNGGDPAPRNRPSLAQAFQYGNGERFVIDANHLKSKGSACSAPDTGDGQANCAVVRTNAAHRLLEWLATDPTGTGQQDVILVGDLNSYAKEDPIKALEGGGYTNLIAAKIGPEAYSYAFDGEWGYLDYALGTPALAAEVSGVGEWHVNADEPSVLDYNDDFKSAGQLSSLYSADEYRISDHDPVVVGLNLKTTVAGLCSVTKEAVTKNAGLASSLCVKLQNGAFTAYRNELRAQSGKALTAEQADALARFSLDLG